MNVFLLPKNNQKQKRHYREHNINYNLRLLEDYCRFLIPESILKEIIDWAGFCEGQNCDFKTLSHHTCVKNKLLFTNARIEDIYYDHPNSGQHPKKYGDPLKWCHSCRTIYSDWIDCDLYIPLAFMTTMDGEDHCDFITNLLPPTQVLIFVTLKICDIFK